MKTLDVYSLNNITPIMAKGSVITDPSGNEYIDLYGGHAVISVGHSHPYYVEALSKQLNKIAFYSNSVINPLQEELAYKLGELSGYNNYNLFLCNSGAEANENAFKLASFTNNRKKIVALKNSFHGRTSLTVASTDDLNINAEINKTHEVVFIELNNLEEAHQTIDSKTAAVIIEGIQGVGGINIPSSEFLNEISKRCRETGALFILDEVQSGYGRTGKFFAHQYSDIKPDIISVAKGMGNGFPIAGILVSPDIKVKKGMLGTTFGGNHLACAAGIAVLDIIKNENLISNAYLKGNSWKLILKSIPNVKEVRGLGLMIGVEFDFPVAELRNNLMIKHKLLVGNSSNKNVIRLLPALNVEDKYVEQFNEALEQELKTIEKTLLIKN